MHQGEEAENAWFNRYIYRQGREYSGQLGAEISRSEQPRTYKQHNTVLSCSVEMSLIIIDINLARKKTKPRTDQKVIPLLRNI
jgi:hypothetical protein